MSGVLPGQLPPDGYAGDLTPAEAWVEVSGHGALLVDVRTEAEWRYVGVPDVEGLLRVEWVDADGARNPRFAQDVAVPSAGRAVVLICRSGQRSVAAAEALTAAGVGPAYNVLDGFEGGLDPDGHRGSTGWKASGLPWVQS